jgi:hypothetical protein
MESLPRKLSRVEMVNLCASLKLEAFIPQGRRERRPTDELSLRVDRRDKVAVTLAPASLS